MSEPAAETARAPEIHPLVAFSEPALPKFEARNGTVPLNDTAATAATARPSANTTTTTQYRQREILHTQIRQN